MTGLDAPAPSTTRLDAALVERALARSRGHARDLIESGAVLVDGTPVRRRSTAVRPGQRLELDPGDPAAQPWVGRAAVKLEHAFVVWQDRGLTAAGGRCLDVGAGAGGFTEVLLRRGARRVVALDVGHRQLAARVAADPRVVDLSGINIRYADPGQLHDAVGGPIDVVVADLSFISLRLVLPAVTGVIAPGAHVVLLVKPQFEVGRGHLGRTGVVASRADRLRSVLGVLDTAGATGLAVHDLVHSPIRGGSGNHEYLLWSSSVSGDDPGQGRALAPAILTAEEARGRAEQLVGQEVGS